MRILFMGTPDIAAESLAAAETTQPAPQAQEAPGRGTLLAILAAALLLTAGAAWMLLHKQK